MRIAVVGAGVSGLVAAWLLQRRHDIVLFEANDYAGGHVHTCEITYQEQAFAVDTGFIVFNEPNYPLFNRLLRTLNVASQPSNMSFSVHCERSGLEYCAAERERLRKLFAQRSNLLSPRFYRMLCDIRRFYQRAPALLRAEGPGPALGEYLEDEDYSPLFGEKHLLPMAGALWSSPPDAVKQFPARALVEFMERHSMLRLDQRPQWLAIRGGSNQYVNALLEQFQGTLRLNTRVRQIQRDGDNKVGIRTAQDESRFDAAVLACHSDQALALLADPTHGEREVLGAIPYQENDITLHTDSGLMPRRRSAWGSWNYRITSEPRPKPLVTYHMNTLQSLDAPVDFFVSLNASGEVNPDKVLARTRYAHPQLDQAALDAQRRLDDIQGQQNTWYCGAWQGFGFHEDGVKSGVAVAAGLGVRF